jgi:hypothetical protein
LNSSLISGILNGQANPPKDVRASTRLRPPIALEPDFHFAPMATAFDPYYKWLGIQPKDQPPNHYRLLGIDAFEPDLEVIDAAANRLMTYLQDVSSGDHAEQSQRLLNEIAAARLCLLNATEKAGYDAALRLIGTGFAPAQTPAPVSPRPVLPVYPPAAPATPPPVPPVYPPPAPHDLGPIYASYAQPARSQPEMPRTFRHRPNEIVMAALVGAVIVLAILIGLLMS